MCKKINFVLNSNQLKIIAIICMTIDHVGYFFFDSLQTTEYIVLRSIGRIAMPLFVFLLIEGYFHTKSIKKYICRIFFCAVITQVVIYFFEKIDMLYFSSILPKINNFNILFSFSLILCGIRFIDKKILGKDILDIIIRAFFIAVILVLYTIFKIDYGIYGFLIAFMFYLIKKYSCDENVFSLWIIEAMIIAIFSVLAIKEVFGIFAACSIIFIAIYNEKRGKKGKVLSTLFYVYFPFHYAVIFIVKLILSKFI